MDHRAVGRVFPGVPHLAHGLARRPQRLAVGNVGAQAGAVHLAGARLPVPEGRADPVGVPGLQQDDRLVGQGWRELAQLGQVVHDPEGAPVGGGDQVVVLDLQVVDGDHREVGPQRLPGIPLV